MKEEIIMAEEWVSENGFGSDCNNINSVEANREMINAYLAGFKASKENSKELEEVNKANEWHKDLPTEDVELAIIEVEDCGYLLCEYLKGIWYDKGSNAVCKDWITRNIKRWKEIIPPKESE